MDANLIQVPLIISFELLFYSRPRPVFILYHTGQKLSSWKRFVRYNLKTISWQSHFPNAGGESGFELYRYKARGDTNDTNVSGVHPGRGSDLMKGVEKNEIPKNIQEKCSEQNRKLPITKLCVNSMQDGNSHDLDILITNCLYTFA